MVRAISADGIAPTMYAWPVQMRQLRLRAGRHMAIDGLDLRLGVGVHGLFGPNGAGKTTLIRALATVLQPHSGQLEILGQPMHAGGDLRKVRRALGYLPQDFGYYRWFTVREFLEYVAWLKEMTPRDVPDAVQRALDRVGLTSRAGSTMRSLSGGMLRRVGIAQAIVSEPAILLLDEPTVGLDPEQRMSIRAILCDLGRDSCVVIATHLVEDAAASCTDMVLVNDGRLVFQGTPADLVMAADTDHDAVGDSELERGYSVLMRRHRENGDRR